MRKALLLLLLLLVFPFLSLSQAIRDFTDNDYRDTLKSQPVVLFYSLSPSMQLSIDGINEIRTAAKAVKATLVLLADPHAKPEELASLSEHGVRFQKSLQLR